MRVRGALGAAFRVVFAVKTAGLRGKAEVGGGWMESKLQNLGSSAKFVLLGRGG